MERRSNPSEGMLTLAAPFTQAPTSRFGFIEGRSNPSEGMLTLAAPFTQAPAQAKAEKCLPFALVLSPNYWHMTSKEPALTVPPPPPTAMLWVV
jgi:hypothetical protein